MLKEKYTDNFFSVDENNGFLPLKDPTDKLPDKYQPIQEIIDNLPRILKKQNTIEVFVNHLPNFLEIIEKEEDIFVIQALYRAYSFILSGYLLEPSYHYFLKTGNYPDGKDGMGRVYVPYNVSLPYNFICNKLKVKMWLDYHYSYSLGNYIKLDKNKDLNWKNLGMACSFSGENNETGFIMLHVYINELSPNLIKSIHQVYNSKDNLELIEGLKLNFNTIKEMNRRRSEMWLASDPKRYNDFRIFIMGSKGNEAIFGDGIVYEGVDDNKKLSFRGQTGAQDDIIPTEDIFSGVINYYPENMLTRYLMELREYRPECVQEFLKDLEDQSKEFNLFNKLKGEKNDVALLYLLGIVYEIYAFRFGHWKFVQSYIMKNTKYSTATGGTPITTWLPNQINSCLDYINDIILSINIHNLDEKESSLFGEINDMIIRDGFR